MTSPEAVYVCACGRYSEYGGTCACGRALPNPVRAHEHEPWQVRDDGCGAYCAACGAKVVAA